MMKIIQTELPGVVVIEPRVFPDDRGFFLETYSREAFHSAGIRCDFVQDNHSFSKEGVLRGMHYQLGRRPASRTEQGRPVGALSAGQDKLVMVIQGRVLDVAVDIRRGSPCFGRWVSAELSAENKRMIFIPAGFAHGFCALDASDVIYKCSDFYDPKLERGLAHDDPRVNIRWPLERPLVSEKDAALPGLDHIGEQDLPLYKP